MVNGRRGPDSSVGVTYFESDKRTKGVGNGKFRATVDGRSRKYYDCHELGYDLARTVAEHLAAENSRRRQEAAKVARDARVVERRNQPRPLTGNCDDIWAAITRIESLVQLQKLVVPVDASVSDRLDAAHTHIMRLVNDGDDFVPSLTPANTPKAGRDRLREADLRRGAQRLTNLRQKLGFTDDSIGLAHTFEVDRPTLRTQLEVRAGNTHGRTYKSRCERIRALVEDAKLGGVDAYESRKLGHEMKAPLYRWRGRKRLFIPAHVFEVGVSTVTVSGSDDPLDVAVRIDLLDALLARDRPANRSKAEMIMTTVPVCVIATVLDALETVSIEDIELWLGNGDGARGYSKFWYVIAKFPAKPAVNGVHSDDYAAKPLHYEVQIGGFPECGRECFGRRLHFETEEAAARHADLATAVLVAEGKAAPNRFYVNFPG